MTQDHISPPETAAEIAAAKTLFQEYADTLGVDLCFQGFEEEMRSFPAGYVAPGGALLLATADGETAGAVGLRTLETGVCEMKRLYVRPACRGRNIGRALVVALIGRARELGFERMRLDTLQYMAPARGLYDSLGFRDIGKYYDNPHPEVRYMELTL